MPVSALLRGVPMGDIKLMAAYLAIEPAPEERIEWAIAQLTAMWAHTKKPPNSEYDPPSSFLVFRKAWDPDRSADLSGLDANDLGVMNALHRKPH